MRKVIFAVLLFTTPAFANRHDAGVRALESRAGLDAATAEKVQHILDQYRPRLQPLRKQWRALRAERLRAIAKVVTPAQLERLRTTR
jgi:hypothetical protein